MNSLECIDSPVCRHRCYVATTHHSIHSASQRVSSPFVHSNVDNVYIFITSHCQNMHTSVWRVRCVCVCVRGHYAATANERVYFLLPWTVEHDRCHTIFHRLTRPLYSLVHSSRAHIYGRRSVCANRAMHVHTHHDTVKLEYLTII